MAKKNSGVNLFKFRVIMDTEQDVFRDIEIETELPFKVQKIDSMLMPYMNSSEYNSTIETLGHKSKQKISKSIAKN